jgi:hypothetical protein
VPSTTSSAVHARHLSRHYVDQQTSTTSRKNLNPFLLIRSHRQHPATTCNLSRVGPYPRVQIRGRLWSSVAVDVATDVGQEIFVLWLQSAVYPVAEHLIPSQVFHDQASQWVSGDHRSCTLRLVWHPVGLAQPDHAAAQGRPSTEPVRASCGSAPRLSCGSPWGEAGGMPHPARPGPAAAILVSGHPGGLPAR